MHEPTHASFFSGVGGLDLGLERAGWRTVSFSEIDPYASAVLAERWPGIPNLGDIVRLAAGGRPDQLDAIDGAGGDAFADKAASGPYHRHTDIHGNRYGHRHGDSPEWDAHIAVAHDPDWRTATLWSGGFPCQDLSVAGKRAGFAGARSSLAFAFLDLVERYRPPAILLENVPGLLSSHRGRDFGTLLDRLAQLGYGWAYRILDARHFGVPQRRRRVFIVALNLERGLGADSAAAVLSVGTRCPRHPATGHPKGEGVAQGAVPGVDIARAVTGTSGKRHDDDTDTLLPEIVGALNDLGHHGWTANAQSVASGHVRVSPPPDPGGVRAPDGLAGRLDDLAPTLRVGPARPQDDLAPTLRVGPARPQDGGPGDTVPIIADTLNSGGNNGGFRTEPGAHLIPFVKRSRAQSSTDSESWGEGEVMPTLNAFDVGDARTTAAILGGGPADDPLLPIGLDSHRYRCCGNGVVSSVAEWIGLRLLAQLRTD